MAKKSRNSGFERQGAVIGQFHRDARSSNANCAVMQAIRASRSRKSCTHFDEPSYIDLHHFYSNLQQNIQQNSVSRSQRGLVAQLHAKLSQGKRLITQAVLANTVGKNLSNARGISIYFPEQRIHPSYSQTSFARSNAWYQLISRCK